MLSKIKDFFFITAGIAIVSAAIFFFLIPSGIPLGSVSGLSMILSAFIPLSVSVITFIINVFFLALGFLFIGKEFGLKTIYTSLVLPMLLMIFEKAFPNQQSIMESDILDVICFSFFCAIGQAILFSRRASSGGLDIAAKLLNKFLHMDLGTASSLSGCAVALTSVFTTDLRTGILAVVFTYFTGLILDHFIFGIDPKRKVCVISKKWEDIRRFLIEELHSGATIYEVIGAYDKEPHTELAVIVDKNEYLKLMNFIEAVDPAAFMTTYKVSEVTYQPKRPAAHRAGQPQKQ